MENRDLLYFRLEKGGRESMKFGLLAGGRSSVGRAPDCDSGCRGFKPRRSPHPFLS